ncbi:hypothetical protein JTB14_030922 [Gonioctena quinquepunctata]|nr:hypothetical protein JTB14_030922 [Gonioctena quinquepunctata]
MNLLTLNLTSNDTLIHYDPKLPLVVTGEANNVGARGVLSHKCSDGTLKPIASASRSFSEVEKRYSTIDKEPLGLVYAVTKFHKYSYGRRLPLSQTISLWGIYLEKIARLQKLQVIDYYDGP